MNCEALNLVTLYAAFDNCSKEDVLKQYAGQQFGAFKPALADVAINHLEPITKRLNDLLAEPDHIDASLATGEIHAREVAEDTLKKVQNAMGFL